MSWPAAAELRGTHAALVPLHRDHAAALAEAVRDGELWHLWYTAVPPPERMAAEIERRLGLQAAALYSVGLLEAMGSQPVLFSPLPEYHGMLACLRLALLAVGAGSLGLAAWRLGE